MNYQELCERIDSPTLQRDLQSWQETGNHPAGYTLWELELMEEYLKFDLSPNIIREDEFGNRI